MFSGGRERVHWERMGLRFSYFHVTKFLLPIFPVMNTYKLQNIFSWRNKNSYPKTFSRTASSLNENFNKGVFSEISLNFQNRDFAEHSRTLFPEIMELLHEDKSFELINSIIVKFNTNFNTSMMQ